MSFKYKLCCGNEGCDYYLAAEHQDKTLSIKQRDLYITFEGGILRLICPACGTRNYICNEEYAEKHIERVKNMKAPHDVVSVIYKKWIPKKNFNKEKAK